MSTTSWEYAEFWLSRGGSDGSWPLVPIPSLNGIGKEGWEVVCVLTRRSNSSLSLLVKRPLQQAGNIERPLP